MNDLQNKLEDWSDEFDWWLEYYIYHYNPLHLISDDLAEISNEILYVIDNINYYKETADKSRLDNIFLEVEINKYNNLVFHFNEMKPLWFPKKEHYNDML